MKKTFLVLAVFLFSGCDFITPPPTMIENNPIPEDASVATFAGGCFWCVETAFDNTPGVYEAISGYAGGSESEANYSDVGTGKTKHKEAVKVHYDPEKVSYEELLKTFWAQIDPTDAGGQFADRGPQYRTAVFHHDEAQKISAEKSKAALENSDKFDQPIATELLPFTTFFPAEEEHQNFAKKKAAYYQRYKEGSGRADFIQENWKK